jgi:hypothetical protein
MEKPMSSEFDRVLSNPDHVIMSQELQNSIPETLDPEDQILMVDGVGYVVILKNALIHDASSSVWKFILEAPGIRFRDLVSLNNVEFHYDNLVFKQMKELSFETENLEMPRVTLTFSSIINR